MTKGIMNILGHEVNYINKTGDKIDKIQLTEQIEAGDKSGTLYLVGINGHLLPIGTWYITDWKQIAIQLYSAIDPLLNAREICQKAINNSYE